MLNNIKTISKRAMSMFLALAMCITAFVLCNPIQAEAIGKNDFRAGNYYYYPKGTLFISEIAFAADNSSGTALSALSGYNILTNSNPSYSNGNLNLNMKENSGTTSYPFVFLGYKTTDDITKALGTSLRAGIFGTGEEGTDTKYFSLTDTTGKTTNVPYKKVHSMDLNTKVGGQYIYLYGHDPADYNDSSIPAQGLPIVALKGWANSNAEGSGAGINDFTPVPKNATKDMADFDEGVSGAGYVYLFYDNTSVYTNVTTAVNSLIDALDKTKTIQSKGLYTTESWNAYQTALTNANTIWEAYNNVYKAGNVPADQINTAVTNLNSAAAALKTTIKIDATTNGGTTDITEYTVSCGLNTSVDFPGGLYAASRPGYTFLGWSTDPNAATGVKTNISVPLGSTLYAIFSINKYSVSFSNPVTGITISTQYVEHGKDAVAPAIDTYFTNNEESHYVFQGWDKSYRSVTSNLSVNATFTTSTHTYTLIKTTPATCTTKGAEIYRCTECGQEKTVVLPIDGAKHTNTIEYPAKASTCQEYGYTAYTYCNDCRTIVTGKDRLPLADHSWTNWTTTDPTCTQSGEKSRKCTVCNKTESEAIPATGHKWDSWKIIKEATCEASGRRQKTCSVCFETDIEITNPLGHSYIETIITPSCTEQGYTLYTCERNCGNTKTDNFVEPTGHSWVDVGPAKVEPTCTTTGIQYQECENCGSTQNAVVPALGHDWQNQHITVEATCDSDGLMSATCDRCGDVQSEIVIPALGHDWDAGVVTKPATCTENGTRLLTCQRDNCGRVMEIIIKSPGHAWDDGIVVTAPTCSTEGSKLYTCTVCDATKLQAISKLPHSYSGTSTLPTCTEKGYTEYICTVCGNELIDDYVPALGHSYQVSVFAPTCLKEGFTYSRCTICDYSEKTSFVPALGHDYVTTYIAPTCTEKGHNLHVCSRGDSEYKDNYVDPIGHNYIMTSVTPTCTEEGYDLYECSACDSSYKKNYVEAAGHAYTLISTTQPTVTQNGYHLYSCGSCNHTYKDIIYVNDYTLVCITLFDSHGEPVREAKVTITNMDTGYSYVIYTDLNGYFTEVLPEGNYSLYIQKNGYEDTVTYMYVNNGEADYELPVVENIECDCYCHQDNFWAKIFKIFMKLRKLFGLEINCCENPQI